jgi:hypothetical protein
LNRTEFISHVVNYQSIDNDAFVSLSEWSEKYPWFSSAHILRAKCLSNQNKFGLKQVLKKAALYASDRTVLYDVIHNKIVFNTDQNLVASSTVDENTIELPPKKEERIDAIEEKEPMVAFTVENNEAKAIIEEVESLPLETIETAEDTSIESTVETEQDVLASEEEEEHIQTPRYPVYDAERELYKLEAERKKREEEDAQKLIKEQQLESKPEKLDYLTWLSQVSKEEEHKSKAPKLRMSREAASMLENFVKNRPKNKKIRLHNPSLEPLVERSARDESMIVSETLAQLYIKQENPQKAIEVYEKLGLQNPQKIAYFAALIKEVETNFKNS